MKTLQYFISFSLIAFLFSGCATILGGYEDRVEGIKQIKRNTIYFESGETFNEYNFRILEDSCITIRDYLKNKN